MDFNFSDDQEALRDAVRKWVDRSYTFERRHGIVKAGAIAVSLSSMSKVREIEYMVTNSEARIVVAGRSYLDEVPEPFRTAIVLRDVEDFTYQEIAKMLDVPIGTVMSRISRGRRLLYPRLAGTRLPARAAK